MAERLVGVSRVGIAKLPTGVALPTLSHASGGRDRWSPPLAEAPTDPTAAVWCALREVLDPEIPVSVVDLGLIYGVRVLDGRVEIDLTFTATACPCMEFIRGDIADRLERETWVESVRIEDVWDPPWTTARLTEEARDRLRRLGVAS